MERFVRTSLMNLVTIITIKLSTSDINAHNIYKQALSNNIQIQTQQHITQPKEPDYEALCPMLGWIPTEKVKCAFDPITQYACIIMITTLCKHYKVPFPAINLYRRNEHIAMDTVPSALRD